MRREKKYHRKNLFSKFGFITDVNDFVNKVKCYGDEKILILRKNIQLVENSIGYILGFISFVGCSSIIHKISKCDRFTNGKKTRFFKPKFT